MLPGQVTSFKRWVSGACCCMPTDGLVSKANRNSSNACSQSLHLSGCNTTPNKYKNRNQDNQQTFGFQFTTKNPKLLSWGDNKQVNTKSSNACLLDLPGFNTTCKKYHNSYQDSQDNFGLQAWTKLLNPNLGIDSEWSPLSQIQIISKKDSFRLSALTLSHLSWT